MGNPPLPLQSTIPLAQNTFDLLATPESQRHLAIEHVHYVDLPAVTHHSPTPHASISEDRHTPSSATIQNQISSYFQKTKSNHHTDKPLLYETPHTGLGTSVHEETTLPIHPPISQITIHSSPTHYSLPHLTTTGSTKYQSTIITIHNPSKFQH